MEKALNAVVEGEMTDLLGVEKGERSAARRGYRSGHYTRQLHMNVGTVELRVPQNRDGRFSTQVFERYRRSEKALMSTLAEMYVQSVSTRQVTKLAESLCQHAFSYGTISKLVATLDDDLQAFATRALDDTCFPYLILDARYEKVREQGAVPIAIVIDTAGKRHLLTVELTDRETVTSWTTFLTGLKARGLRRVEYVVSDRQEGLKRAIEKVLTTALSQRCAVHFLRNAVTHTTHQTDPDYVDELKLLWSCSGMKAARRELRNWIERWGEELGCDALVTWVEENIEETFSVYRLPRAYRKRMKSTNMLERYNEEIYRWNRVVRILLPQRGVVSTADSRMGDRDPRSVGDGQTLSQSLERTRQRRSKTGAEITGGGMIDTHGRLALTQTESKDNP